MRPMNRRALFVLLFAADLVSLVWFVCALRNAVC